MVISCNDLRQPGDFAGSANWWVVLRLCLEGTYGSGACFEKGEKVKWRGCKEWSESLGRQYSVVLMMKYGTEELL